MNVINLILSSIHKPWIDTEPLIRHSFKSHPDVERLFYRGSATTHRDGDVLHLAVNDKRYYTKTIMAFRYLLEHFDFDYVFRSNNSSYVDYEKYLAYLNAVPEHLREYLYSGKIYRNVETNFYFCSGCGYTVSRKCVELLVKDAEESPLIESCDDVKIAASLQKFGVKLQDLPMTIINEVTETIPLNHFHYRCKPKEFKNYVPFITETFTYLKNALTT